MKILIISSYQRFGGSEQAATYLADGLRKLGHTVKRVCFYGEKTSSTNEIILFGRRRRIPLPAICDYLNPLAALRLWYIVKKEKPDVLNFHNINDYAYSLLAFLFLGRYPMVWTLHDWWPLGGFTITQNAGTGATFGISLDAHNVVQFTEKLPWVVRMVERLVIRYLRLAVATPTRWLKDSYKASLFADLPFTVIPLGIDLEQFQLQFQPHPAPPPISRILYVGRVNARKGFDVLEKAFASVLKKFPDAELWAVGIHGPDSAKGSVRMFHKQPTAKLPKFYHNTTLLVSPGLETPGLVNLEALACGLPVIAADIAPVREYLRESGAALYRYRDADHLAHTMIALLENPVRRREIAERGRLFAEKNFSHIRMAERYAELFRKLYEKNSHQGS